ncbi:MAG: GntR family transcriptional regulator [Myxococcales bacterium]|nr:GntR family transcriptional regulator [Myxococcales bacterium]
MTATVRIDLDSGDPVWRQIADQVRAALVSRRVKPGAQLATVRELALDLGVNHNTVAEAYRQLAAEGFLQLERGVGALVLDREAPRPPAAEQERFARRLKLLLAEARAAGVPVAALRKTIEEVL